MISNIILRSLNFYLETKNNEISDAAVVHGVRNLGSQFHRSLVRECCRPHHGGRLVFGKVTSITQRPPPMCTFPRVNITYPVSRHVKFLRRNTNGTTMTVRGREGGGTTVYNSTDRKSLHDLAFTIQSYTIPDLVGKRNGNCVQIRYSRVFDESHSPS